MDNFTCGKYRKNTFIPFETSFMQMHKNAFLSQLYSLSVIHE